MQSVTECAGYQPFTWLFLQTFVFIAHFGMVVKNAGLLFHHQLVRLLLQRMGTLFPKVATVKGRPPHQKFTSEQQFHVRKVSAGF